MSLQNESLLVVVPVRNKRRALVDSIGSIVQACNFARARLIVVDNGSTDGSREYLASLQGTCLELLDRPGITVGAVRNEGAAGATSGIITFLDSDILVPIDHFQKVRMVMASTGAQAVGRKVGIPDQPTPLELTWHRLHLPPPDGWVSHINSGNFAIKADAFHSVGGFDRSLPSGEDAELCLRLTAAGFRLFQSVQLDVVHLDNPRTYLEFFRKEEWRGRGMWGTARIKASDLPLMASITHLLLLLGAAALLAGASPVSLHPVARAGIAAAVMSLIPVLAVSYRFRQGARRFGVFRGVWLYWLYFSARAISILDEAGRHLRKRVRTIRAQLPPRGKAAGEAHR